MLTCRNSTIPGMNQNTLWWKLSPFSLTDEAKIWYDWKAGRVGGDWIKLKDEFFLFFFPVTKVFALRIQLLTFKQDKGSLGIVWERSMLMVKSRTPHRILEDAEATLHWFRITLMIHPIQLISPKEKQQVRTLSAASSHLHHT